MYFFFHLLTGIILGLLAGDILHDRRWIIPCAIGAVLPDLIDKPLGFIVLAGTVNSGRLWFHSILILAAVLVPGLIVWKYRGSPVLVAAALGIASHQFLDTMWRQPVIWFYPLLGPVRGKMPPDYLFVLLRREFYNPLEWILGAIIVIAFVFFLRPGRILPVMQRHARTVRGVMAAGALLLCVLAGVIIGQGVVNRSLPYLGRSRPETYLIAGIVIALAAYLCWRWQSGLKDAPSGITGSG
jgi:membrane-bound metal-dependent hydrolase YbcI (DUF457 family)